MPGERVDPQVPRLPPSLTRGLITCIGNKRALLQELAQILGPLVERCSAERLDAPVVLDAFCGSGSVARACRYLGARVTANDWEPYAAAVTEPYLVLNAGEMDDLLAEWGGADALFEELNASPPSSSPYIATHYAPARTDEPRLGRERLFYTQENAARIDAIRDAIEERFPSPVENLSPPARAARMLALASLLSAASIHANTSGVFKAYHRGFGGLGRDAMSRITSAIRLRVPELPVGPRGSVTRSDAVSFLHSQSGDICYLDPPYSGHQYGSNYFMLNTILEWKRDPVDDALDASGNLVHKAGIPSGWRETRSAFCSRPRAHEAIEALVDAVDARWIVMSYSTDGIVETGDLASILARRGDVTAHAIRSPTYRGGRQSLARRQSTGEFCFVVKTGERSHAPRAAVPAAVRRVIALDRLRACNARRYVPARLLGEFSAAVNAVCLAAESGDSATGWVARTGDAYRLEIPDPPEWVLTEEIEDTTERLLSCAADGYEEELDVVLGLLRDGAREPEYQRRVPVCLRKFAYRKYRSKFEAALARVRVAMKDEPDLLGPASAEVESVTERARLRFGTAAQNADEEGEAT